MGKVQWGVIVAIVAAIVAGVLATQGVFTIGGQPDDTPDPGETSVTTESDPDIRRTADESTDIAVPDGDDGDVQPTRSDAVSDPEDGPVGDAGTRERDDGPDDVDRGSAEREVASDPEDEPGRDSEVPKRGEGSQDVSRASADADGDDAAAAADAARKGPAAESPPADGESDEHRQAEDEALQAEAESYVRQLVEPSDEPVPVESAEGFIGGDRPLTSAVPESESRDTVQPEAEEVDEPAVAGPDAPEASGEAAAALDSAGTSPVSAAQPESAEAGDVSTVQPQMPDDGTGDDVRAETAVVESEDAPGTDLPEARVDESRQARVDLPLSEDAPVTIAELLGAEEAIASDAVFYVHTVRPDDNQGIWGIIHDGILENFAEGVAVHRGESTETYRVDIPPDADEREPDSSSSFLGRIIYEKSQKTYVYNYQTDRLGKNPDLIIPGQEIVIVSFTPEELIEIYKYFARGS